MDANLPIHPAWPRPDQFDAELAKQLRASDVRALDTVIAAYWRPLVIYVTNRIGNMDAAEDIVQDVFIDLWDRRASWRAGSVRAFLYTAARNRAVNARRADLSRLRRRARLPRLEPRPPSAELEQRELRSALAHAIDALPPRRREIFELSRFENLTYSEIAEVLGISPQTVANQLSRALATLRATLAAHRP